jgi:hypothetical protein
MSDLERAMNPGGLPGPVPSQGEGQLGLAKQPYMKKARKKRADPVKAMKRKRRAALTKKRNGPKVAKAKRAPRGAAVSMDLAGTMELLGSMHRTDVPVFQVISEALSSRAKPSRRRLLAAIAKVFG